MKNKEYDLKKAAEHLLWRFNSEKGIYISNKDKSCLNTLLEWINNEKKTNIEERAVILFTKIYIYVLNQNIIHYDTDVLDKEPQKQLNRLLDLPLENFYEAFYKSIQNVQINRMLERCKKEDDNNFTKQELLGYFEKDFLKAQLNHIITEALNRF